MAKLNAPMLYGILIVAGAIAYGMLGSDAPKPAIKLAPKSVAKAPQETSDFTDADFTASFGGSKAAFRDLFLPVVKTTSGVAAVSGGSASRDQSKFPADVAGGDGNWEYTGFVRIDGVGQALLENASNHQGAFVKEGDLWKGTRIRSVTQSGVAFVGKDGTEQFVLRLNPYGAAKSKGQPAGGPPSGTPPVAPPGPMIMQGPIPGNIVVSPMQSGVRFIQQGR